MSGFGGPPPYYGHGGPPPPPPHGHWHYPPHHPHHPPPHHPPPHHPPPPPHQYPPPPDGGQVTAPSPYPYYMPAMMVPVPVASAPPIQVQPDSQPTYVTNYIYHGENPNSNSNQVSVVETSGDYDWVPTTATNAHTLTGRAVIGGHEGWDGSPLWVIRSWHNGDLIPGKLSIRHNSASIMCDGKEIPVQNIDVLCSVPENLRWVPASNGNVPPGAIPGGRTASGEPLYVGRAKYQLSITPGKVHPSHNACYIGFGGAEVAHKMYDVLCRVS